MRFGFEPWPGSHLSDRGFLHNGSRDDCDKCDDQAFEWDDSREDWNPNIGKVAPDVGPY
jgi:hypothetical protein